MGGGHHARAAGVFSIGPFGLCTADPTGMPIPEGRATPCHNGGCPRAPWAAIDEQRYAQRDNVALRSTGRATDSSRNADRLLVRRISSKLRFEGRPASLDPPIVFP